MKDSGSGMPLRELSLLKNRSLNVTAPYIFLLSVKKGGKGVDQMLYPPPHQLNSNHIMCSSNQVTK